MQLRGTHIDDAVGEAFAAFAVRLIVTADDAHWLDAAAHAACGYGTSIIGCDAEAALEHRLAPDATPDGRPGAAMLFVGRTRDALVDPVRNRAGQGLMTCPTTAVFDGLPDAAERAGLGDWLRYFGDGYETRTTHAQRQGWTVPVMAGEFFCEATVGVAPAVAGGTILIGGDDAPRTLTAARRAVDAIAPLPDVITPFPGGVCRCGSKVRARRYRNLIASTHDAYCPTLRGRVESRLPHDVACVYEIVIDGLTRDAVAGAVRTGIEAAAGPDARWISTSGLGGRLGTIPLALRDILAKTPRREP